MSKGDINHEANFHILAVDFNLGCIERDNAFRFLLNKKYITNSGMGYGCSITPEGIATIANVKRKRGILPRINISFGDYFKEAILSKVLDFKQI